MHGEVVTWTLYTSVHRIVGCRVSDVTSLKGGDIKVGRRRWH